CIFRHPYPVGYRAKKHHFHRDWLMEIEDGGDGPVFKVISDNGKVFSGPSPTAPWTDICIALAGQHGKTRISGPLFFGFSDPLTQGLIQSMDGYAKAA
ncbi:hypothetical protein BDK51DRAFT_14887, partial [Blyttiomyces helicus]